MAGRGAHHRLGLLLGALLLSSLWLGGSPLQAQDTASPTAPTRLLIASQMPASPMPASQMPASMTPVSVTPAPSIPPSPTPTTPARLIIATSTPLSPPFAPTLGGTVPSGAFTETPSALTFPIRPGSFEGSISDAVPSVRYRFTTDAGATITLSLETTSGNLDPLLSLYAPAGALVARNDDRASGDRDSALAITITQGGEYIVEASRFSPGSTGTFRLTLVLSGIQVTSTPVDPFSQSPPFAVPFELIGYQEIKASQIANGDDRRYFAVRGQRGDLLRAILTRTSGDLAPTLHILDPSSVTISRETATRSGETIAYVTLPDTGWYLIEALGESGAGTFDLYVNRIAATTLNVGDRLEGQTTVDGPTQAYIINARIGDNITINVFTNEEGGQPEITLLDLSLRLVKRAVGDRFATLRTSIPRSAPYLLQVSSAMVGSYTLRFDNNPLELSALGAQPIGYNEERSGTVTDQAPVQFYRFAGKANELVTVQMNASDEAAGFDPYLILMDGDLNEIAANDDTASSRNARILQVRLPKEGDYVIAASRSGLANGRTSGGYQLSLTAGAIALERGALTFTLNWTGAADMNLFVRDPDGRIVSYANPGVPSGGTLQIDSNTGCDTLSAEPVEHIFWGANDPPGDYEVWAWAQAGCGEEVTVPFRLQIMADNAAGASDENILEAESSIAIGQRFETAIRVGSDGTVAVLDAGTTTQPSPQQIASEGGDIRLDIGSSSEGAITTEQYARFYQFVGRAGQGIQVSAERLSGDLDPVLILLDENNQPLPGGTNDDAAVPFSASPRDAQVTYTLPDDGTYILSVTRFGVRDGTTSGTFRLTLADAPP